MGKSKMPTPKALPTAGEELSSWLASYEGNADQLARVAQNDEATRLALAEQYGPEYTRLGLENLGQYNRGLLDLNQEFAPLQDEQRRIDSGRALASAQALQPQYDELTQGADAVAIRKLLGEQINSELGAGASLDPEMAREVEQSVRQAQVGRGMTHGNSAVFQEAMTKGAAGQQLRSSRQSAAMNFLSNNAATRGDVLGWYQGTGSGSKLQQAGTYTPSFQGNNQLMQPMIAANMQGNAQTAQLRYNAAAANAANQTNWWAPALTIAGVAAGGVLGGPMGAVAGGTMGQSVGTAMG